MVLTRIYPFYKGINIAKSSDGYKTVVDAHRNMKLDKVISDFDFMLPNDFWDDYYYVSRVDENSEYREKTVLIDNWTEIKSNKSIIENSLNNVFSREVGTRWIHNGVEFIKTKTDVNKDIIVYYRPESFTRRKQFLKKVKNQYISDLLLELLKIENSDVSKMNTEEQQRCVFVYEELDRLGYYPRIQRDMTEYNKQLREYIRKNVEFREIHKDYYLVIPLKNKQQTNDIKSFELF